MLYIGIDLGTSACKLLLVDEAGQVQNTVTKEYPLSFPRPGWSEQDPAHWWNAALEGIPAGGFTKDAVHEAMFALIAEKGVKNGWMLYPLRVAVSGKQFTPGGGIELCAVLGREESLRRVKAAIARLEAGE